MFYVHHVEAIKDGGEDQAGAREHDRGRGSGRDRTVAVSRAIVAATISFLSGVRLLALHHLSFRCPSLPLHLTGSCAPLERGYSTVACIRRELVGAVAMAG